MVEIVGDLWQYDKQHGYICCITTNGTVKKNGEAVMGKGCAKEAATKYPQLPKILGASLAKRNGVVKLPVDNHEDNFVMIFPVKHEWHQKADPLLIEASASQLAFHAKRNPGLNYVLPRPGCGNGKLNWKDVKQILERSELPDNVMIISPK